MQKLNAASRKASWLVAVIVGSFVAWSAWPLTAVTLGRRTADLQHSYADVYSNLHEQPFAYCDSYYKQREAALTRVGAGIKELDDRGQLTAWAFAREYDSIMGAHYEEDCASPWRPYMNAASFQAVFVGDYPLYFLISELNLTEVGLAVLQVAAGWLGVVATSLLSVYFWRSVFAPVVGLVLTSFLAKASMVRPWLITLPDVPSTAAISPGYLYPLVTVLLLIALVQPTLKAATPKTARAMTIALAVLYGFHAMLYYVVDPPVARMFVTIGLAYVGVVGLASRNWLVVSGAVLAGAVHLVLDAAFRAPGLQIYSAVTLTDHLASKAYTNVMIYMGLLERPSPFGLFYMDEIFAWVGSQDPLLVRFAPGLAVHHSFAHTGSAMVWDAFANEPLTVLDAVVRRLLIQVFYQPLWFFWKLSVSWTYTLAVVFTLTINALAWLKRPLFVALTPITLCVLFDQYAANTIMTLVHNHPRWSVLGVMLLFATIPQYTFAAIALARESWRRAPRPGDLGSWLQSNRRRLVAAAVSVAVIAAAAPAMTSTLKEERAFVQIWMEIHSPAPGNLDILGMVDRLDALRAKTGDRDGRIAMWIASQLYMHGQRYQASPELRARVDTLRHTYFRLAVALAPDNERYVFAARFLRIDEWESVLREGLARFPDSIYAPGAAAALRFYAQDAATRASAIPQYDALVGRFLESGASRIPGFEAVPRTIRTEATKLESNPWNPDHRAGAVLTMAPGAVVFLADRPTHGSETMRIVCYVDLKQGDAESGVFFGREGAEPRLATVTAITAETQLAEGHYRSFEADADKDATVFGLWLRAGRQGATLEVRDYYPMLDRPKQHYRSGLMTRVNRRLVPPR